MNRILRIDTENLIAEVEPGVVTEEFQKAVEKLGLFTLRTRPHSSFQPWAAMWRKMPVVPVA